MKKTYLLAMFLAAVFGALLIYTSSAKAQETDQGMTDQGGEEVMPADSEAEPADTGGEMAAEPMTDQSSGTEMMPYGMGMGMMGYRGGCTIQGTQTCPRIQMVPKTVCRQVPTPITVYRSRPFEGRGNCSNCTIQGTQTCPETQMTYRTVCRQIMVPKTVYETKPFQASTCGSIGY